MTARGSTSGATAKAAVALTVLGLATGVGACGGGERQDVNEPSGKFPVTITDAKFPPKQRLAEATDLELTVENAGDKQIPDLSVTIDTAPQGKKVRAPVDGAFSVNSTEQGLANPSRPVWILEENWPKVREPGANAKELERAPSAGAEVAQTNTFAFGPLAPGESKDMVWHVTPVMGGAYTVQCEVSAGLFGKAEAVSAGGGRVKDSFDVKVSTKPPRTRVNDQGQVVVQ
jgi:hypothetical protein